MKILVINCGSSSIKYQLYDANMKQILAKGIVQKIGQNDSSLRHETGQTTLQKELSIPSYRDGFELILQALLDKTHGVIKELSEISAVGHRAVHGGEKFFQSTVITEEVIQKIEEYAPLAPLHNPVNLMGIREAMRILPDITMESMKYIWPVPLIFIISMGGIYLGVFTPSEGGAVGAFLALFFSVVTKRLKWNGVISSVSEATSIVIMIMFLIIGGKIFGQFLSITKIPFQITDTLLAFNLPPFLLLLVIFMLYFICGFFMEGFAVLILFTPLFYPLIIKMGYDGIWYGIMTILMLLNGFLTPPVGVGALVTSSVTNVRVESVFKGLIPFWITLIISTILIMVFPQIATFLPNLMR